MIATLYISYNWEYDYYNNKQIYMCVCVYVIAPQILLKKCVSDYLRYL